MNKKITATLLSAAMVLSSSAAVFANEDDIMLINETAPEITAPARYSDIQTVNGKISEIGDDFIEIAIENRKYILNIGEETVIADKNGIPMNLTELKEGGFITAYASTNETKSIPAQAAAYAVISSEENEEIPVYTEISNIEKGNNGVLAYSNDGQYVITLSENTEYKPFKTRQIVKADDITEGTRLLVFSKTATMSIPALMNAEKVIIIGNTEENSDNTAPSAYVISSADKSTETDCYSENGINYLPVRAVSEALGYDVNWSESLKAVTVGTVQMGTTFNVGINKYTKAKMKAWELSSAPIMVEDKMYVPTDFFTEILELNVTAK